MSMQGDDYNSTTIGFFNIKIIRLVHDKHRKSVPQEGGGTLQFVLRMLAVLNT